MAKPVAVKTANCLSRPAHDARRVASFRSNDPLSATEARRAIWQRLRLAMLPAVAALALGGCVAAPVSDTLESAALTSPETTADGSTSESALLADGSYLGETPFASVLTTVPVPTRSPSERNTGQQLALLADDAATPAPAAAAAVPQTAGAGGNTQDDLETAALASEETPAARADTEPGSAQAATSAVTKPVKPAQEVASAEPLKQQKAAQPKKPGGLFGMFMANRQTKPKKVVKPGQPAIASASNFSRSGAGLPGVQRKSAIFGINGDTATGEPDVSAQQTIQVASVGGIGRLISPTGLILQTDKVQVDCFKPELLAVLKRVERRYGKKVMVTSGYRSPKRNRRAGGVSNSTHIYCKAADIQVEGVSKWDLAKYLRSIEGRGGVGTYCRTNSVHIDVGSQRDWHHPCRRSGSRSKKKKA